MNLGTQIWIVYNTIHAMIFISFFVSGFWIFQKTFDWKYALKRSVYYYLLLRIFFASILFLQELL